jgi:hypothetical protein
MLDRTDHALGVRASPSRGFAFRRRSRVSVSGPDRAA